MLVCALASAACCVALLIAEYQQIWALRAFAKTSASLAFIATALAAGALGHGAVGLALVAALSLSLLGDVLLLWTDARTFGAGIVAFLLAHVAYVVAFVALGVDLRGILVGAAVMAVVDVGLVRWLGDRPGKLKPAVAAYIVVISAMAACAAGVVAADWHRWPILMAAVTFVASDVTVARDRFVAKGFENRLVGLPLYYGAQIAFAVLLS